MAHPDDIVCILAPIGADAGNIRRVLDGAGIGASACAAESDLFEASKNCAVIVLTEEAVTPDVSDHLFSLLRDQPAWSDLPVILITSGAAAPTVSLQKLRHASASVTILERPLRMATLIAAVRNALVARRRQYQVRDLLRERDALLASLESRVQERTADLQKMVEEMEAFSYSVSHDLRSPLRSLAGYAHALQEDYAEELSAGAQAYLTKIARAAQRMDRLTQDLLAYTRIARGDFEITDIDLDPLLSEVIEQYPAIEAVADQINVERPLGVVRGHTPSLIQCFSNLIGNAAKFSATDRPLRIDVYSRAVGDRLRVFVRDNGVGVDPADTARIFRMFERAASPKIPGTGIGLAIVRKAAERMGGLVGVESHLGVGSEFWLELSLAKTGGAAPAAASDTWSSFVPLSLGGTVAGKT